jgi:AcrR family transcriptional regulator
MNGAAEESGRSTFERLLDAAAALFSQKGYAATSTREIAGILGIRKASLYYHIENKEDLLYAICKSSLEQIRRDVAAALENVKDPLERTSALVRAHIRSLVRDQTAHSVAVGEMHALSGARLKEVIALRDAYEELVRSVLQDARKAGVLRDDIGVKYLCLILLGLLNRVEMWYRRDGALSPDQLARVFEAIFLTGAAAR